MKILHITDLHFQKDENCKYNMQSIVETIINKNKGTIIDFIVFTGDLVFSGDDVVNFYEAENLLLNKLSTDLNVPIENIIITCGNHDVHRNQELPLYTQAISEINTEDNLTSFISDRKNFEQSLKNIENYNIFSKSFHDKKLQGQDCISDIYTIHPREINNKSINFICINTAWRSNSDSDEGNLLFPTYFLKEIVPSYFSWTYS